jgi:hypothetical protein
MTGVDTGLSVSDTTSTSTSPSPDVLDVHQQLGSALRGQHLDLHQLSHQQAQRCSSEVKGSEAKAGRAGER